MRDVERDTSEYQEYLNKAGEVLAGRIVSASFMDIGFVLDGEEVEPQGEVRVEVKALGEVPEGTVNVVHFTEVTNISTEGQDKRYPQCDALDPGPGTHAIQYIHSGTFSFLRPIYGTVFSEKFVQNAQFPSAPMRVLAGGIYTLFLCRINSTVA